MGYPDPVLCFNRHGKLEFSNDKGHELASHLEQEFFPHYADVLTFLVDQGGEVQEAYYCQNIGYHLTFTTLNGCLNVYAKCTEAFRKQREHHTQMERSFLTQARTIAMISHEMRNPLNAMLCSLQMLLDDGGLDSTQVRRLDAFREATERLMTISNDLLEEGCIEEGKISIEQVNFSLPEFLDSLWQIFRPQAKNKGVSLRFLTEEGLPHQLKSDPVRLSQILTNLLGNALKFTPTGGKISLQVYSGERFEDNRQQLFFEVIDTGEGISKEKLKDIFAPYSQASTSWKNRAGAGLGLSIARRLVELLEGNIRVESHLGKGTKFQVELFLKVGEEAPQRKSHAPVEKELFKDKRVLVADDDKLSRGLLMEILSNWGIQVFGVSNGLQALQMMEVQTFNLVILDVEMPELDGRETLQAIRRHRQFTQIPVFACTGSVSIEKSDRANASFDEYLMKPINLNELLHLLKIHLQVSPSTGKVA